MKKCKIQFEDIGINEILYIVNKLNEEIYDQCGDEGILYNPVSFECDGYSSFFDRAWIKFYNEVIWDSKDNERGFDEENNEYEPLEDYLRREIRSILNTLLKIKM